MCASGVLTRSCVQSAPYVKEAMETLENEEEEFGDSEDE